MNILPVFMMLLFISLGMLLLSESLPRITDAVKLERHVAMK